jgi:hypothetical protein
MSALPPGYPGSGTPTDWGEFVQPMTPGNLSGVARRVVRDRHPQPAARSMSRCGQPAKSGFKAGLRRREIRR